MTNEERIEKLLHGFFLNGIGCVNDPSLFVKIEEILDDVVFKTDGVSEYCLMAERTEELDDALEETGNDIFKKYMSVVFNRNNLTYASLWKGVDDDAKLWHNDYCEGSDLAFLLYFHDLNEETGGGLQIIDTETDHIITVWPKKYDIVMFEQHTKWRHRVTPLTKVPSDRTVMNFGFHTEKY
jgi:hypothetical protein